MAGVLMAVKGRASTMTAVTRASSPIPTATVAATVAMAEVRSSWSPERALSSARVGGSSRPTSADPRPAPASS
jgi:hypothetical protein